ncbi:MAG: DUF2723 domain-containing protein [bacterium]|nr:DUF2723 domain-containing protein [bacterium]
MNKWLASCIFFFIFGIYLHTLSPAVGLDDSGELTCCAYLLSIAHAPGYPLYLLLGKIFTFLPFGEVAYRLNLASAVFGALSCTLVFSIVFFITQQRFSALISSFCLAFSQTFWTLSNKAEVYTLNTAFVSLLIFIFLIWRQSRNTYLPFLFFFIYGLSLGNHLTIVLFLPVFLYFFIKEAVSLLQIAKFIPCFLIGLSIYIYLPLRSFQDITLVNWSKITTLNHFSHYVTGSHFKNLLFDSSFFEVIKHLGNYFLLLITQFPVFAFGIGIIGIIKSFGIYRDFSLLLTLMWGALVIFCINYNIPDIWSLYLPTYLFFALFVGLGVSFLIKIFYNKIMVIIIFLSLFLSYQLTYSWFGYNFNKSKYFFPLDFCSQALEQVSPHSLIVSNWSYATCFWYCQYVTHLREDVQVLSSSKKNIKTIKSTFSRRVYLIRPKRGYFKIQREEVFKVCLKEIRNYEL